MWVRIKEWANIGDCVVGVYYRPLDQEEEVDEAFYKQLEVAMRSSAIILMGEFTHPNTYWKNNTSWHKRSRRFLESTDDKFLLKMVEEPV